MYISNLEVKSNVAGISNGNNIATGNIEFWPTNYGDDNYYGIPNASSDIFDFGDSGGYSSAKGHGSMQVHNYGASQTLWAFNHFNSGTPCIGIGNDPAGGHTDWTFNYNAGTYTHRRMHVFVLPGGDGDNTAPSLNRVGAAHTLDQVSVQFSEEMSDSAGDPSLYSIDNGVAITDAILKANKRVVILLTSPLTAGQSYTLTAAGMRDRSANGNLLPAQSSANFTAPLTATPALPDCLTNVVESSQYRLIHELSVVAPTYYANGCPTLLMKVCSRIHSLTA